MKYAKITDMFAKILFSEELLVNKLCRRALCAITALLFVLCSLPAGARTETEAGGITSYAEDSNGVVEYEIKPRHSDGVTLEYSKTVLRGNLHSGVFTFAETKTVTLVARFAEGWSYNDKYSVFFPSNPARRTILLNSDASIRFSFSAIAGESVAFSDLYLLGIYAAVESLPRLDITTLNDFSLIGKDNWVSANFSLTLGTKKYSSGEFSGSGYVKGRGNLSWTQPQKPYSIKLEQKTSLLDIPATKRYAIVASYSDPSLMRNLVTYKAGALLSGMDYVPKCEFVDVYFNGEYNGIYILIERPGIESTKIDIDEANESDITGGYFIEKDIAMKVDFARDMWFGCPYWANQTQDYFVLKQPEPASSELTARMLEYLEEHMKSVHNAVMGISGEDYQKYIDVDSWIDYIIIQEITKNIDGNFKTSCYLYKQSQDDRLYMTAIWDFDIAFGLTAFNNASAEHNDVEDCVGGRGPVGFIAINSSAPWFNALYHNYPDFQARFKQRYKEYRSTLIPEFFALINEQAAYLYNCTAATEEKWEKNFDHGVNFLTNWLTGRIEWLDSQLLDGQSGITDLNYALNVPGGSLEFTSGTDDPFIGSTTVSRGMVGNTVVGGRIAAVSSNAGENNSESDLRLTVTMKAGDTLSFDYCVSSGVDTDRFICTVGTKVLMEISGETGWTKYIFTAPIDGRYCFRWSYEKGNDKSAGVDDCAYIDNVELKAVGLDAARGDVNMDGKITLSDSMAALRTALGLDGFDPERRELSDYNCDGAISVEDAVAIAKKVMHIV